MKVGWMEEMYRIKTERERERERERGKRRGSL
jgi:hypothetical protein